MNRPDWDEAIQYEAIVTALKEASSATTWAQWRERYNTNHPEHVRRKEIENPTIYASANWFAAKSLYCSNRYKLDNYVLTHSSAKSRDYEIFDAMRQVVAKEMEEELEKQMLNEEDTMYNERDLDETEEVYELDDIDDRDIWDGDDYLGEEEFDDDFFDDDDDYLYDDEE